MERPAITIGVELGGQVELLGVMHPPGLLLGVTWGAREAVVSLAVHEVEALVMALRSELAILQREARVDTPGQPGLF